MAGIPEVWPSCFGLAEFPLRYANEIWIAKDDFAYTHVQQDIDQAFNALCDNYKAGYWEDVGYWSRRYVRHQWTATQPFRKLFKTIAVSVIAAPYTLAITPLTILLDLIAGVAESAFRLYKGQSAAIPSILRKKWIASPIQHLTFLTVSIALATFYYGYIGTRAKCTPKQRVLGALFLASAFSVPLYGISQNIVAQSLPTWARPDNFVIFIEGGARDERGKKYTDPIEETWKEYYKSYKTKSENAYVPPREKFKKSQRQEYNSFRSEQAQFKPKSNAEFYEEKWQNALQGFDFTEMVRPQALPSDLYERLKVLLSSKATLLEIFELQSLDMGKVVKAYKIYGVAIHPDKNGSRALEASQLFKALSEARSLLTDLDEANKKMKG